MENPTNNAYLNAQTLELELNWLSRIIETRLSLYHSADTSQQGIYDCPTPNLNSDTSPYAQFLKTNRFTFDERLILILALAPHIRPQLLDVFFAQNAAFNRGFSEFGGAHHQNHTGFLPTGETALFLLAGIDLHARFKALSYFNYTHIFYAKQIITLSTQPNKLPQLSGMLQIDSSYVKKFTSGLEN